MKVIANAIVGLTAVACGAALAVSVYPGALNALLFVTALLSVVGVPVAGVVALVGLIVLARRRKLRAVRVPWGRAAVVGALLFGTYVLLKFYVPRRVAFAASRASFERMVPQAPPSPARGVAPLNTRLGIYSVDAYAADPRGGVYFRVYSGADGFGPDRMSYGFAHRPNPTGTPFGAARYRTFPLGDGWYWFRASDDWR